MLRKVFFFFFGNIGNELLCTLCVWEMGNEGSTNEIKEAKLKRSGKEIIGNRMRNHENVKINGK